MMIRPEIRTHLRKRFKPGTRVRLVRMNDPYTKLKPGDEGTVCLVDDIGTIFVDWDCGSTLGVVFGEDACELVGEAKDE
jgi:hypothetical protein